MGKTDVKGYALDYVMNNLGMLYRYKPEERADRIITNLSERGLWDIISAGETDRGMKIDQKRMVTVEGRYIDAVGYAVLLPDFNCRYLNDAMNAAYVARSKASYPDPLRPKAIAMWHDVIELKEDQCLDEAIDELIELFNAFKGGERNG